MPRAALLLESDPGQQVLTGIAHMRYGTSGFVDALYAFPDTDAPLVGTMEYAAFDEDDTLPVGVHYIDAEIISIAGSWYYVEIRPFLPEGKDGAWSNYAEKKVSGFLRWRGQGLGNGTSCGAEYGVVLLGELGEHDPSFATVYDIPSLAGKEVWRAYHAAQVEILDDINTYDGYQRYDSWAWGSSEWTEEHFYHVRNGALEGYIPIAYVEIMRHDHPSTW